MVIIQLILIFAQYKNLFPAKSKENTQTITSNPEEDFSYIEGILSKIDNKITTLENLIMSADEKINELKKLQSSKTLNINLPNKDEKNNIISNNNNSKREKVISLKNKGCDVKEIVKITGLSKPEVELILNLFSQGV